MFAFQILNFLEMTANSQLSPSVHLRKASPRQLRWNTWLCAAHCLQWKWKTAGSALGPQGISLPLTHRPSALPTRRPAAGRSSFQLRQQAGDRAVTTHCLPLTRCRLPIKGGERTPPPPEHPSRPPSKRAGSSESCRSAGGVPRT